MARLLPHPEPRLAIFVLAIGYMASAQATPMKSATWIMIAAWVAIVLFASVRSFSSVHYQPNAIAPHLYPEPAHVGYTLYRTGEFGSPFYFDSGPTSVVPPAFPFLLAGIYRVFGEGAWGAYVMALLEPVFIIAQVSLMPLLAQALGAGIPAGLFAAMFAAAGLRQFSQEDNNLTGLVLMLATLLACYYARARSQRTLWWIAAALGVLWGLILLTEPSAALVWLVWLPLAAWVAYHHGAACSWLPLLMLPMMLVTPWLWRNYTVFHKIIPVRGNFGLELFISHNPCAKPSASEGMRSSCYPHPNVKGKGDAEAQAYLTLGEVAYNQAKLETAKGWILANTGAAAHLTLERIRLFWFPGRLSGLSEPVGARLRRVSAWAADIATLLSIFGLGFLFRANRTGFILCGSFLVVFPLTYYLMQFEERYREPMMWVIFLLAGVALHKLAAFARIRRSQIA
jgi:hypothetical protein